MIEMFFTPYRQVTGACAITHIRVSATGPRLPGQTESTTAFAIMMRRYRVTAKFFFGAQDVPVLPLEVPHRDQLTLLLQMFVHEFEERDTLQGEMLLILLKRLIIICTRAAKEQSVGQTLSRPELELYRRFNLVTSRINGCRYCQAAHTAVEKMTGFSDVEIPQLRGGTAPFDAKPDVLARSAALPDEGAAAFDDDPLVIRALPDSETDGALRGNDDGTGGRERLTRIPGRLRNRAYVSRRPSASRDTARRSRLPRRSFPPAPGVAIRAMCILEKIGTRLHGAE